MTLVKIPKTEKEGTEKALRECGVAVNFYTIEENSALVLAEIAEDDPAMLFVLGKYVAWDLTKSEMAKPL